MEKPRMFARRHRGGEGGAVAVEFALILPLLLLLVFGIIEFGFGYHAWDATQNAAREGARLAAVDQKAATGDYVNIVDRVTTVADGSSLDTSAAKFDVAVSCKTSSGGSCPSPWEEGDIVRVAVSYHYDFITALPGLIPGLGNEMNMTSVAEARFEGP